MREVRRKTADRAAVPYLMKAAGEGTALSWDHYEAMLPQDGFGALGLACLDCLLGPCRLNPFEEEDGRTVCGFSRDELALRQLRRLMGLPQPPEDGLPRLLSDAARAYALRLEGRALPHEEQALRVGLGALDPGSVNICLETSLRALWLCAVRQGAVAGANMAGGDERYGGSEAMNAIELFGLPSSPWAGCGERD